MKTILLLISIFVISLSAADGRALSTKCTACHGANFEKAALGKSAIVYGQSASDIYGKLIAYKQGTRNENGMGALMKGQVATMSNNDMWAVAEYIDSLYTGAPRGFEEVAPAAEAAPATENDWPYACSNNDLLSYKNNRYFIVSSSTDYPIIGADAKTIKIDKKNKIVNIWTVWLASPHEQQNMVNTNGQKYLDYGVMKRLDTINYQSMRTSTSTITDYSCNGSVISTYNYDKKEWSQIIPDSVMEGIVDSIKKKYNLK